MSLRIILSTLLASFILSACQVKEADSSGGLISGHSPTTNKFTVTGPAADNYVTGDVISFQVKFPFNLAVTGTPRLRLMVGATTRYADYVSGDGASTLHFSYTVVGADNDSDGVALQALELNGGTLKFTSNGVVADANIATVGAATYSSVLIDNTVPTVTTLAFSPTTIANYYPNGSTVSYTATFSEPVYVTGSPQIAMTLTTGGLKNATYSGGSGTTTLLFSYTVTQTDFDKDGYVFGPAILPNSGTIKDGAGNDATLTYNAATVTTDSATRDIDGRLPHILSVTPPANGTYLAAQNLDVTVEFDRVVNVSTVTAPFINLTIGSNTRQAAYYSGTGTNTIVFRYTTIPGDVAPSGIVIAPTINNNTSATISGAATCASNVAGVANTNCFYGDVRNTVFIPPVTTGVIINSIQPQAISVNRGVDTTLPKWGTAVADSVWIIGQDLLITVGFNTNVFVDQGGGTPRIPLTLTSGTVYATYLSGGDGQTSLVFKYTVQPDDLAMTGAGITLGTLDLNGGTITNSSNTNALTTLPAPSWVNTKIKATRPTISSIAKPAAGTYSVTNLMNFTVTWSEAVKYTATNAVTFPVNIGGTSMPAVYISGDTTTTIIHRPNVAGLNDADGVIVSSPITATNTVTDVYGNPANVFTFTPPATTDILVDTVIPTISSITPPLPGRYRTGDPLDFTVTFSESITIASGSPFFGLKIGTPTRNVTVVTPGTGTIFTFRYTVQATDTGTVSIPTASLSLGGATIRDPGLNNATLTFTSPTVSGIIVDEVAPTNTGVVSTAGTYVSAGGSTTLVFSVTFNDNVTVTGGAPYIDFTAATGTIRATYNAGTSSAMIKKFEYTVLGTDMDLDGLASLSTSIELNGATFQDANNNDAVVTLSSFSGLSTTLLAPHLNVWMKGSTTNRSGITAKPTISTTASFASPYYVFNGTSTLSFNISGSMNAAFMAIRAPTSGATYPQSLYSGMSLKNPGGTALIDIQDGGLDSFRSTTGASGTGSPINNIIDAGNRQQVEFIYSPATTMNAAFIPAGFSGSIAEILIFNSALSVAQKDHVLDYLDANYVTDP